VATYILKQRLRGRKRYPLVLMLEPLFRCNLACAGCGKIQYPAHVLKRELSPEECFRAVEECGAPMVSIPGGEPLMHPRIDEIVAGIVERKKYVYLCTNALLLKEKLGLFTPSKFLNFSIHMDGLAEEHDFAVCREGVYDEAVDAIREALKRGFRVTSNTTLFDGVKPERVRDFFDTMMDIGVEGMMISPGYSYAKAPDQEHFLRRSRTREFFGKILSYPKRRWKFNQSPLFLEFLMGHREYRCTPWGNPTYNVFGWQKPCYLLQDGYCESFDELLESTDWNRYGTGNHEQCADCMVHCGYEPSAVNDALGTVGGFLATVRATVFGLRPAPGVEPPPGGGGGAKRKLDEPSARRVLVDLPVLNSQMAGRADG
jgi:hopanoid biosynthesis associated radical SAM protein HpnH